MAINVNQVYKTVLLILNKEQRGYITPDEFNKIATQVQLETFENYSEDLNQLIRVPQTDTDYADRVANIDEKLSIFKRFGTATYDGTTTSANPYFTLPTDLYRLGAVTFVGLNDSSVELQRLQRNDFYNIQKSQLTASTKSFPTYLYENEKLYVRPSTIISGVNVDYLKGPDNVRWGYSVGSLGQYIYDSTVYGASLLNTGTGTLTSSTSAITAGIVGTYTPAYTGGSGTGLVLSANVTSSTAVEMSVTNAGKNYVVGDVITIAGGVIQPNPVTITLKASDFNDNSTYGSTDLELHPSEQTDVILKILMYSGVVIRDPQVVQVAAQMAQQDEVNEKR